MTLIDLLTETTKDCADILLVIPKAHHSLSNDKRRIVSKSIEKQLKRATLTDKIYCNVFFNNETDIENRIALFAEEQVYTTVRELNKTIKRTHGEMPLNGNLPQTVIDDYEKKMKKLESFFPSDKTDHYACHKLEVLLQMYFETKTYIHRLTPYNLFVIPLLLLNTMLNTDFPLFSITCVSTSFLFFLSVSF